MQIVCNVLSFITVTFMMNLAYYFIHIVINLPMERPAIRTFSNASFLTIHLLFVKYYISFLTIHFLSVNYYCCTDSCDDILHNM